MTKHIVIALDKWKDCLSSDAVGRIIQHILKENYSSRFDITLFQVSDGGDGFLQSLKQPLNLQILSKTVFGPLGTPIDAHYGISQLPNSRTQIGVIEIAAASGLAQVPPEMRNPLKTTSYGTGQLISHCHQNGCQKIYVGLGGSATVDGGLGALKAIGAHFEWKTREKSTEKGEEDILYGKDLEGLKAVSFPEGGLLPGCDLTFAHDVLNPIYGPKGAAYTFGPQKGAKTPEMREFLENGIKNLCSLIEPLSSKPVSLKDIPGTGAAGGIGGSFIACCQSAKMKDGMELFFELVPIEAAIQTADLVITGEGKWDATSQDGKAPYQIYQMAKKYNKPCIVVCGKTEVESQSDSGLEVYDLASRFPLEECLQKTQHCLQLLFKETIFKLNHFFKNIQ